MKYLIVVFIYGILTCALLSCGNDGDDTQMVWGVIKVDTTPNDKVIKGASLAQSGADYRGFCKYENKKFSFGIGDPPPVTDFRVEMSGIEGPPSENPYTEDGTLRSDETGHFTKGQIWNQQGGYIIEESSIIEDRCQVVLFAAAGSGDLTPKEYGKKKFQYVVKVDCLAGLDSIPSEYDDAGQALTGFELELWFNNCD